MVQVFRLQKCTFCAEDKQQQAWRLPDIGSQPAARDDSGLRMLISEWGQPTMERPPRRSTRACVEFCAQGPRWEPDRETARSVEVDEVKVGCGKVRSCGEPFGAIAPSAKTTVFTNLVSSLYAGSSGEAPWEALGRTCRRSPTEVYPRGRSPRTRNAPDARCVSVL